VITVRWPIALAGSGRPRATLWAQWVPAPTGRSKATGRSRELGDRTERADALGGPRVGQLLAGQREDIPGIGIHLARQGWMGWMGWMG